MIEPPLEEKTLYEAGSMIKFGLLLVGRAIEYLPYFVYTFEALGEMGIGKGRGRYCLDKVTEKPQGMVIYQGSAKELKKPQNNLIDLTEAINCCNEKDMDAPEEVLTLSFLTPTRIKHQRRLTKDLTFPVLMKQVLRRLFLLWYFHCDGKRDVAVMSKGYHKRVLAMAEKVKVRENHLKWVDWERYSHRQRQKLKLGGFVGEVSYEGPIRVFLPFLRAAEVVHIGKGTTFGLGKFVIRRLY